MMRGKERPTSLIETSFGDRRTAWARDDTSLHQLPDHIGVNSGDKSDRRPRATYQWFPFRLGRLLVVLCLGSLGLFAGNYVFPVKGPRVIAIVLNDDDFELVIRPINNPATRATIAEPAARRLWEFAYEFTAMTLTKEANDLIQNA